MFKIISIGEGLGDCFIIKVLFIFEWMEGMVTRKMFLK